MLYYRRTERVQPFRLSSTVAVAVCLHALGLLSQAHGQLTEGQETAGDQFQNVSILSEMPADQMGKVMNLMSASLGVNCGYCHAGTDFAKEDAPHKEEARRMLEMTFNINREHFGGKPLVTCNTCHQGRSRPPESLSLSPNRPPNSTPSSNGAPTIEIILAKYFAALGGHAKLETLKSIHIIGQRVEPDGRKEPEELWQSRDGLSRMSTLYGDIEVIEGYDGTTAWKQANDVTVKLKPDEAEQLQTEVGIAFGTSLKSHYAEFTSSEIQRLGDVDLHVIHAKRLSGLREQLYFDASSGLLVRRLASVPTVLGKFDYQVDYNDYKSFDGLLVPTKIHFAVPNISWTRDVTSVEFNVEFDTNHFRKP